MNFKDMEVHFIRPHSAGFCDILILFLIKDKVKKWNLPQRLVSV